MIIPERDFAAELSEGQIVTIDGFLPQPIVYQMIEAAGRGVWTRSTVQPLSVDVPQTIVPGRTSSTLMGAELGPWFQQELRRIEESLARLLDIRSLNLEPWQVTRYECGEAFDYHLDCGGGQAHPSGERKRTVMVYLETPESGGATHFRALNLEIAPLAGRLVVWNNLLPTGKCNFAMIHSGQPVLRGCKTALLTWEHETRYTLED